ncbi:splicing factor 3B subunit 1-like [Dorcoceras hygrometricum]|uniref:Splicing factor 3B subunit 1-like n=1 Tax=Dorcoceras hygrometricum TaxID=472368 RepID=A0A2Z7CSB2_9LAMI|nr:splicing factor 3B subunit 1-like [Dorcoceras hygrometricum]
MSTGCIAKSKLLFTVSFSGEFPLILVIIFHDRGSVGLLSRSSFILYQSWMLWLASCGARSCCPVPVLHSSGVGIESLGLVFVVTIAQKYKDARASGNTALSSPCWDLLAAMRRVVNYHSSGARQQQVELFDASSIQGTQVLQLVVGLTQLEVPQEVITLVSGILLFILLSEMASSYISNALQINFDSFLGIQDNEMFVGVFNLPTDGLIDLSEVPNDLVLQARTLFSHSGKPVQFSCKKRLLKYEFCFLNDILAKSITVKAGSFDAVTQERFLMMTAIHFGIKVNWSEILFEVLKEMVNRTTRRAKGFDAQICVLLKGDPAVTLGEAKTFPPLKILSEKTVTTYVSMNKTIDARGETDEPNVATVAFVKKKSVSKKRPAAVSEAPDTVDPTSAIPAAHPPAPKRRAPKRKLRMTAGSDDVDKIIDTVITETSLMETDMEEPSLTISDDIESEVTEHSSSINDEDDNLDGDENEIARKMASFTASKQIPQEPLRSGEDADMSGFKQPKSEVTEHSSSINDEDDNLDGDENEIARKMASFTASKQIPQEPLRSGEDADMSGFKQPSKIIESAEEEETDIEPVDTEELSLAKDVATMMESEDTGSVSKALELNVSPTSDEESMSLEYILKQILADVMLPSVTAAEITRIKFARSIEIREVHEGDWYKASLPQISTADKGKAPLVEDTIKGHRAREMFSLICADIDFLVQLREKWRHYKHRWIHGLKWERICSSILLEGENRDRGAVIARSNTSTRSLCWLRTKTMVDGSWVIQEANDLWQRLPKKTVPLTIELSPQQQFDHTLAPKSALSLDILASQRKLITQQAAIATGLDNIRKDVDDTKAALSNSILDFHAQAQENYNNLSSQLGELVAYINRGGNDKKGECGSIRPQPPPDDQNRPTGGSDSRGGGGSGGSSRIDDRRGSSKRRSSSGAGGSGTGGEPYGPYKKDAQYWLFGKSVLGFFSFCTNLLYIVQLMRLIKFQHDFDFSCLYLIKS